MCLVLVVFGMMYGYYIDYRKVEMKVVVVKIFEVM